MRHVCVERYHVCGMVGGADLNVHERAACFVASGGANLPGLHGSGCTFSDSSRPCSSPCGWRPRVRAFVEEADNVINGNAVPSGKFNHRAQARLGHQARLDLGDHGNGDAGFRPAGQCARPHDVGLREFFLLADVGQVMGIRTKAASCQVLLSTLFSASCKDDG